jgi:hypothetical protein
VLRTRITSPLTASNAPVNQEDAPKASTIATRRHRVPAYRLTGREPGWARSLRGVRSRYSASVSTDRMLNPDVPASEPAGDSLVQVNVPAGPGDL